MKSGLVKFRQTSITGCYKGLSHEVRELHEEIL